MGLTVSWVQDYFLRHQLSLAIHFSNEGSLLYVSFSPVYPEYWVSVWQDSRAARLSTTFGVEGKAVKNHWLDRKVQFRGIEEPGRRIRLNRFDDKRW